MGPVVLLKGSCAFAGVERERERKITVPSKLDIKG